MVPILRFIEFADSIDAVCFRKEQEQEKLKRLHKRELRKPRVQMILGQAFCQVIQIAGGSLQR